MQESLDKIECRSSTSGFKSKMKIKALSKQSALENVCFLLYLLIS